MRHGTWDVNRVPFLLCFEVNTVHRIRQQRRLTCVIQIGFTRRDEIPWPIIKHSLHGFYDFRSKQKTFAYWRDRELYAGSSLFVLFCLWCQDNHNPPKYRKTENDIWRVFVHDRQTNNSSLRRALRLVDAQINIYLFCASYFMTSKNDWAKAERKEIRYSKLAQYVEMRKKIYFERNFRTTTIYYAM